MASACHALGARLLRFLGCSMCLLHVTRSHTVCCEKKYLQVHALFQHLSRAPAPLCLLGTRPQHRCCPAQMRVFLIFICFSECLFQ